MLGIERNAFYFKRDLRLSMAEAWLEVMRSTAFWRKFARYAGQSTIDGRQVKRTSGNSDAGMTSSRPSYSFLSVSR